MVARRLSILDFRPVVYESGNFDLNTVTIVIVRNENRYNTQYTLRVISVRLILQFIIAAIDI